MKRNCLFILIVSLFLAAGFCFCDLEKSFAEEGTEAEEVEEQLSLKVYYDNGEKETLLKSYDASALKGIKAEEGNKEYTYSSYNTYPTSQEIEKVTGPTVRGILNDALRDNPVNSEVDTVGGIANEWVIEFRASDGVKEWFTKAQLFNEPRYYFPNAGMEAGRCGQPVLPESFEAVGEDVPTEVPAVISLTEKVGKEEAAIHADYPDYVGRLLFGQTVPNEQNRAEFVKYMTSRGCKIIIHAQKAAQWNPITGVKSGSAEVPFGGVTLDRDVNDFHTGNTPRYWIFYTYTTDGSEPENPTNLSNMYNYNNFQFDGMYEGINKPVILSPDETLTLKVKVWGYGLQDSVVKTMTFTGKDIGVPELTRAEPVAMDTIRLTWSKVDDVRGYKIYRADSPEGPFERIKTVYADDILSYDDTTCALRARYYYQVRAFNTYCEAGRNQDIMIEGELSNVKSAFASLNQNSIKAPALTSAKRYAYNTIRLNWTKVNYVTGYKIYRSKGNTKNYKLLKTISKNTTLTYKDTTCLTGTRYYYYIKAYTPAFNADTESAYTLYSKASTSKYATAYLAKTTIKSLIAGKKKATIKWVKIPGASGYVIYRSTKKSSGYKAVKTITKGGTVSFVNKKLKKGKRYYFKIRAYRTVSGKRVYSGYSAVKSVIVK